MLSEPNLVVPVLARILDDLGIPYAVGGSLANSMYGVPRATQGVDLVGDIPPASVDSLTARLADHFHVSGDSIREAVEQRSSFNGIHLDTMFKADIFVARTDARSRQQLDRAHTEELDGPEGRSAVRLASPEDTLLHKLVWYRLGGESSDRRWSDILGILTVQGDRLDGDHLGRWAAELEVTDLLAQARKG